MAGDLGCHTTGAEALLHLLLRVDIVAELTNRMCELGDVLTQYAKLARNVEKIVQSPFGEGANGSVSSRCG